MRTSAIAARTQQHSDRHGQRSRKRSQCPVSQRQAENLQFNLFTETGGHEQLRESLAQPIDPLLDQPRLPRRTRDCSPRLRLQPALIAGDSYAAGRHRQAQYASPPANRPTRLPGGDTAKQRENHEQQPLKNTQMARMKMQPLGQDDTSHRQAGTADGHCRPKQVWRNTNSHPASPFGLNEGVGHRRLFNRSTNLSEDEASGKRCIPRGSVESPADCLQPHHVNDAQRGGTLRGGCRALHTAHCR